MMYKVNSSPFCLQLLAIFAVLQLAGCVTPHAFYMSPRHGSANHYKAMPIRSDSIASASYLTGMVNVGFANDLLRDDVVAAQVSFHRVHQTGLFNAYYGGSLAAGSYHMTSFNGFAGPNVDVFFLDSAAGHKFFGSAGLNGGICLVKPFGKGGEWRIVGIEVTADREFGNYLATRNKMEEWTANLVDKKRIHPTISISTDFVGRLRDGSIGYKAAYTRLLRSISGQWEPGAPFSATPQYMTHTLHLSVNRWAGFAQVNMGSHSFHLQLGLSRRIAAKRISQEKGHHSLM